MLVNNTARTMTERAVAKEIMMRFHFLPAIVFMAMGLILSPVPAQAQSMGVDPPSAHGVPSTWDRESIDTLGSGVRLDIPLYSAHSGDMFGWSVNLTYDSRVWDMSDYNYPSQPGQAGHHKIGFGNAGYGWKVSFGRVYSQSYTYGGTTDTFYYFEGQGGDVHRLFTKTNLEWKKPSCTQPGCATVCVPEAYWYAYDGSGVRAQSNPADPTQSPSTTTWTVWYPDGTTYTLARYLSNDPNLRYPDSSYKGWSTTKITGPQPKNGGASRYSVSIAYHPTVPECPQTITDNDFPSRTVSFVCTAVNYEPGFNGGLITSIDVPAPTLNGRQVYQFNYGTATLWDPYQCIHPTDTCTAHPSTYFLSSLTAAGVSPAQTFQFDYVESASGKNFGEIRTATLPGGAERRYSYNFYNVWQKDYPIIYSGPKSGQFSYFPVRALGSRELEIDGTTWRWEYLRANGSGCSPSTPTNCYNTPVTVNLSGPFNPADPIVRRSTTVYELNGTLASSGTPSPLDGTLKKVRAYAGYEDPTRLLRSEAYTYGYDVPVTPPASCNQQGTFSKSHYADNIRMSGIVTTYEDDGKTPHDVKAQSFTGWRALTVNYGRFDETIEYAPDGVTPFRRTKFDFALTTGQLAAWVLMPVKWMRVSDGNGNAKEETDYTFDDYGRKLTERKLYAPGASPLMISQDDLLTTISYDSTTGNQSSVLTRIPRQGVDLGTSTVGWSNGFPTRQIFVGNPSPWYKMDVSREPNWGLPNAIRKPSGTGVSIAYDSIGRQTTIQPLANSPDPPVSITYQQNQVTSIVGDGLNPTSIQAKTLLDDLGRVKEEQVLKTNDVGADQWVSRKYTRDVDGNPVTVSEWAPVGTTGPVTTFMRYGQYDATADVYVDPFSRVRKTVGADGAIALKNYQGLVTTTIVQGIQGGSAAAPTVFNASTIETSDVFGRLINTIRKVEGATDPDQFIDYTYDLRDRRLETKTKDVRIPSGQPSVYQVKSVTYDPLGRIAIQNEPERGKIWFGTVLQSGAAVSPDGYDSMGNVIRYQTASGYSASPAFHYRMTYDAAGRLARVAKETDATSTQTRIADYEYDKSANGMVSGQNLDRRSEYGQLCTMKSYDDLGNLTSPVAKTDYYYKGSFGRFNQLSTVLGGWSTAQNIYYTYDALGQVAKVAYPTSAAADPGTGMPPCTNSTCLTIDRTHGLISHMSSSRGYSVISNARYGDSIALKEWVAGNGITTTIVPDGSIGARPHEIKVTTGGGGDLWTTGVYSYDGAGWIKSIGTDTITYDALGRLKEAWMDGTSTGTIYKQAYAYDPFGNILSKTDSIDRPVDPQPPVTTSYNVDAATNRIRGMGTATNWTYASDGALTHDDSFDYGYDNSRRLNLVRSGTVDRGAYAYDAFGLRTYRKEANGKEVYYLRDPDGNVLSQFSRPVNVTAVEPQWDRDFVYFDGKRVNMVETPLPNAPVWMSSQATSSQITLQWYPTQITYGYLVYKKTAPGSQFVPIYAGSSSFTTTNTSYVDSQVISGTGYTYKVVAVDYAGNLGAESAERFITAGDTTPTAAPTSLSATPGNAQVALTWVGPTGAVDLGGYYVYRRLVSGSYGSPLNSIALAASNYTDLNVVNGTTYYYVVKAVDTAGNLSAQSNEVNAKPSALQQGSNDALPEFAPSEPAVQGVAELNEESSELSPAPYAVVGQVAGANPYFLHADHLGSIRLVTNAAGAVVTGHKFLSYGEEIQPMNTLNPYRFAGYERDSESGKDYARARYYTGTQGRWLTPDPLGEGYQYANNSPLNASDPTGLSTTCMGWDCVCVTDGSGIRTCWCHRRCYVSQDDEPPTDPLEVPVDFTHLPGEEPLLGEPPPKPEPEPCLDGFLGWIARSAINLNATVMPASAGLDWVPATGKVYVNFGAGLGEGLSVGGMSLGNLLKAGDILLGWSGSASAQVFGGVQAQWTGEGGVLGPVAGMGAGLNYTYGIEVGSVPPLGKPCK